MTTTLNLYQDDIEEIIKQWAVEHGIKDIKDIRIRYEAGDKFSNGYCYAKIHVAGNIKVKDLGLVTGFDY